MLPKFNRLTQKKDVKRVMTKGRSFFVKEFGIKSVRRRKDFKSSQPADLAGSKPFILARIAIIIPKKFARTAVLRNRIKRQVRHIFLKRIDQIQPGYDIVFIARQNFLKLKFDEMDEKIISVLKRIGLIKI